MMLVQSNQLEVSPPGIVQRSTGWCSPNIANVIGNVTVTCVGIDPRAVRRLNAELTRRKLDAAAALAEANSWASKYKDLEKSLLSSNGDQAASRRAEEALHKGDLEGAAAALDNSIANEEASMNHLALNHFNRAKIADLQFEPSESLRHYKLAYQYRPEVWRYQDSYVEALYRHHEYDSAEQLCRTLLRDKQLLSDPNAEMNKARVAAVTKFLADIYDATGEIRKANPEYARAVYLYRDLAKSRPARYKPALLLALNSWGVCLTFNSRRKPMSFDELNELAQQPSIVKQDKEAEALFDEALALVTKAGPAPQKLVPLQAVWILKNLTILYAISGKTDRARRTFLLTLESYQQADRLHPGIYTSEIADTEFNLASFYDQMGDYDKARESYQSCLKDYTALAQREPNRYLHYVAMVQQSLSGNLDRRGQTREAEIRLEEALRIYQLIRSKAPFLYREETAMVLSNIAMFYLKSDSRKSAEYCSQAAELYQQSNRDSHSEVPCRSEMGDTRSDK